MDCRYGTIFLFLSKWKTYASNITNGIPETLTTKDKELACKQKKVPLHITCLMTLLLLILLPAGTLAAKDGDLWVTFPGMQMAESVHTLENGDDKKPIGAVSWWYSEKERAYFLFLPAFADLSNLRIWFSGAEDLTIDGKTIKNGESVSFPTPGTKFSITLDKAKYELYVMQSANIPAMFLNMKSGSAEYIHKNKKNEEPGSLILASKVGICIQRITVHLFRILLKIIDVDPAISDLHLFTQQVGTAVFAVHIHIHRLRF